MDKLKEACLQSGNFTTVLIHYYSQVIVEENSDKVRMLRIEALRDLSSQLLRYEKSGYDKKLLASLAVKKAELIMQASTKSEMHNRQSAPSSYLLKTLNTHPMSRIPLQSHPHFQFHQQSMQDFHVIYSNDTHN